MRGQSLPGEDMVSARDAAGSAVSSEGLRCYGGRPILNHMIQYRSRLDAGFSSLADPTRRGILERLGNGDASISDLASRFDMTLTGMKGHVQILEAAGFVTTEKVGRVRTCRLGPRGLDEETDWINRYRQMLEARLDQLGEFLKGNGDEQ